jgi:hypothetical protein
MAILKKNWLISGLSGRVGDLLFKNRKGKIIVMQRPNKPTKPPSEKQLANRARFARASRFSSAIRKNPELLKRYDVLTEKPTDLFHLAVSDAAVPPTIHEIDIAAWQGNAGDSIRIHVTDNVWVATVSVTFFAADGTSAGQGAAQRDRTNPEEWRYTSGEAVAVHPGMRIVVRATDLAENVTEAEVISG